MASIWKGTVSFGLVSVPVELKTAVREDHISFRLLHEEDLSPVKYERVCASDGETIPWSEIVKGYEYQKGKFVVMTDDDFKAAAIAASQSIDIMDFVNQDEIDPRFFDTPYYLVPGKGGDKSYALLRDAMQKTGTVGIGKIIIRQKQHVAAVKVLGHAMVLELMRFENELVDAKEYSFPSSASIRPQEMTMATQLIESLQEKFDPSKYTDEYRANLMKIIKAKTKGKEAKLEAADTSPEDAQVLDLMERLQASLAGGKKSATKTATSGHTHTKSAPAHAHSKTTHTKTVHRRRTRTAKSA